MTEDKNTIEKTAPVTKPKFPLDRLCRDCQKLFGVTTSTFDGATFGLTGTFTVDEIKTKISGWQNKKIKFKKSKKEGDK